MNKNFAVCILSYNREEYLDKTIGSFKKINFPPNKIFIYDDLSNFSKNRAKILKKYNQYNFIINYKRLGLSKNISNILKLKKYDYVLLFEDHDLIHRDYFKEINKIIEINPDLSFIVTERLYIDKNDNLIKKSKPKIHICGSCIEIF